MIIEIRNQLKGQGFKIVLWVTLIAMVLLFSPAIFRRQTGLRSAIATVNGHTIEVLPYERKVAQETERLQFFREQFGAQADMFLQLYGLHDPKTVALQSLIQEALLDHVAEELRIHISSDYIVQLLQNPSMLSQELSDIIPMYLLDEQRSINVMRLNQYLNRYRLSITDFEKSIEEKLKRSLVLSLIGNSAYISPRSLKEHFINTALGKSFLIAEFPLAHFLTKAKEQQPTSEEIASFFEKNHKKYWSPEKRSGFVWEFSPESYSITIARTEIESYYNNQKTKKYSASPLQIQVKRILLSVADQSDAQAVKAVEERAQQLKKELTENPQDFDRLAKQYSDDKESAAKGGLLNFFKKGDHDPAFERAAFRLKNDGDISDVIVTNKGFEIIQRVARKPITYKPLASVESDIIAALKRQKFKTLFMQDMSRFMNRTTTKDMLQPFAIAKKATAKNITSVANDDSVVGEKLFKLKNNDWTFFVDNNTGYALNLVSIEKAHKPDLAQVENKVLEDFYNHKARELQKETVGKAKSIAQEQSFDSLKKQFGAKIVSYGPLKKDDNEKLNELNKKGIPVREMFSLEKKGSLVTAFNDSSAYLIKLEDVEPFDSEKFEEKKSSLLQELYTEQESLIERGFVASLYRNATIQFIESLHNIKEENLPYE